MPRENWARIRDRFVGLRHHLYVLMEESRRDEGMQRFSVYDCPVDADENP
jgi:hypothetical protein